MARGGHFRRRRRGRLAGQTEGALGKRRRVTEQLARPFCCSSPSAPRGLISPGCPWPALGSEALPAPQLPGLSGTYQMVLGDDLDHPCELNSGTRRLLAVSPRLTLRSPSALSISRSTEAGGHRPGPPPTVRQELVYPAGPQGQEWHQQSFLGGSPHSWSMGTPVTSTRGTQALLLGGPVPRKQEEEAS